MRCQEVLENLTTLAYDELDATSAAACQQHLAQCESCQEEWSAIRATLGLLDLVPRRQTQVDLAAVCLRISREQRRAYSWKRWGLGLAAAAALLVCATAAQLLAINVEPGRLIVAWNAPAAGPAERVESPQGDSGAGQAAAPVGDTLKTPVGDAPAAAADTAVAAHVRSIGVVPNALVELLERDNLAAWRRRHRSLDGNGEDWRAQSDDVSTRPRGDTTIRADDADDAPPPPVSYSELRRHWLGGDAKANRRTSPEA